MNSTSAHKPQHSLNMYSMCFRRFRNDKGVYKSP